MLRPPTTNDPALNRFLEEVASTIQDRVRPEEGWTLSDFASSVSEVISDKRDLIDIVTQYDNIEGLSEVMEAEIARLKSDIQDSMALLSSVNSKSVQFVEVMEWWDQNYTIIFDAQEALSIFQEIHGAMAEHQSLLSQTTAAKEAAEQAAAEVLAAEESVKAAEAAAKISETNATDAAARAEASETEVSEAREYVSGLHEDLSPGGSIMTSLEWIADTVLNAGDQAVDARDAAAGHADRAEAAADGVDQVVADAATALEAEIGDVADRIADIGGAAVAAREGAEAARDETSGMLAQKADLVGGVVPSSQIPAVAMTRPHVVADRAGLLGLSVQEGDVGIIPDGVERGSYMLGTGPASEFSSWKPLVTPEAPVSSVNGQTGTITLGAADVGAATAGDVAAVTGRVSALESSRPTRAEVQARPAFWLWDGTVPWTPPAHAQPGDTVLNTATKEIHRVEEVV